MELTFELIMDLKQDSRMFWLSKCSCKELKELVATKLINREQRRNFGFKTSLKKIAVIEVIINLIENFKELLEEEEMTIDDFKAMGERGFNKFIASVYDNYNARKLRAVFRASGIEVDTKASMEELVDKLIEVVIEEWYGGGTYLLENYKKCPLKWLKY